MDKYESMEIVGEGSYGVVMKCRHRETGQVVAIKKFLETEEDIQVRKMAFREIRALRKLRHENLVNMIEVFRRRKRFYIVLEYLDHTILNELERCGDGLGHDQSKRYVFQVLRGLNFCHNNHIMHRDVKPENILVSPNGIIKLCDFGFARFITGQNESCTDYVATRWYRAPELLVGDPRYGKPVDVWATGCLYAEMVSGHALFPGNSDVDQLYRITKLLGDVCGKHQSMISRNGTGKGLRRANTDDSNSSQTGIASLRGLFPTWSAVCLNFLGQCLRMDPDARPRCSTLLQHPLFTLDGFVDKFLDELQRYVAKEYATNPLIHKRPVRELRSSIASAEHPARISKSDTGRWQTTILKETRTNNKPEKTEISINEEDRQDDRPHQQISRPRELCYFGSVSVIPNTTYIRRLKHKGILIPDTKVCSLPSLVNKDFHRKTNGKRKRLDLPSVDR
ncbi:cyclin-dependent kinase-like 1 isoform X2 [Prorops nasuta]